MTSARGTMSYIAPEVLSSNSEKRLINLMSTALECCYLKWLVGGRILRILAK